MGNNQGKGRLRVALVYGGRSAEREVSLASARTVAAALDPEKYEVFPVRIESDGGWASEGHRLALVGTDADPSAVDLIFPVLHGPFGEDGSIQGVARMAGLPCVGADLLGSALCMDKQAAKRLMRDSGLPVAPFRSFRSPQEARSAWPELEAELGSDLFVKPANLGSSVGVSRARSRAEYEAAVSEAFLYDLKVIVERRILGREVEVAVLGRGPVRASLPGEVIPEDCFYSYEAKYIDEEGASIVAPARMTEAESEACRRLAIEACEALCVEGMARVDMFLCEGGRAVANEVNTIPGFTERSMYPLLWQASGLRLPSLVDALIEDALAAQEKRDALRCAPPVALSLVGEAR
jgi:D-alanine--D-alanine ligase